MDDRRRDFLILVAYIYLRHSSADDAVTLLEAVHLDRPHDHDVVRLLAYGYLQVGRYAECLDLTNYLLGGSHECVNGTIWLLHCRALQGSGQHEEARELWKNLRLRSANHGFFKTTRPTHEGLRSVDVQVAAAASYGK